MLIFSFNLSAQIELEKVEIKDEYSWRTHSQEKLNEYYFNLNPISNSSFKYHFRFDKEGQLIDLFSDNGNTFKGRIINHIYEYKQVKGEYGKESIINNYVFEQKEIDDSLSSEIGKYLIEKKVYTIPTDSLIPNWNFFWLHCGAITLESKIDSQTFLSSFICHWNQEDSIKHIFQIKEANEKINEILELEKSYSVFKVKLERGKTYSSDGYMLQYFLTEKQQKRRNRGEPKREYLKSISDTITNHLENRINSLISNPNTLDCFDEYYIIFSKRGKFKKLKFNTKFRERFFDKEYQKCRRIIKRAMKEIKIDFVNPKYEFVRKISFYKDEINVYDPTIY